MHRSGTSCLAGSLEEAGLHLGDVNTEAPANARGNRENRTIMDLHDAVLLENGYSWDNPPTTKLNWSVEQRQSLLRIINSYPVSETWGFKDPRSVLLLDEWLNVLPNLRMVASFRHPASVAASLRRRNQFSWEQGFNLWLIYNQHLLLKLKECHFQLISFDQAEESYRKSLYVLADALSLTTAQNSHGFFSGHLRNELPDDFPSLPKAVAELYEELKAAAI